MATKITYTEYNNKYEFNIGEDLFRNKDLFIYLNIIQIEGGNLKGNVLKNSLKKVENIFYYQKFLGLINIFLHIIKKIMSLKNINQTPRYWY